MNKETVKQATKPGERLFIDISLTEHESYGKAKFWLLIVDDATDFCWSYFFKSKSETKEVMIGLIKELSNKNQIKVKRSAAISQVKPQLPTSSKTRAFGNYLQIHHEKDAATKWTHRTEICNIIWSHSSNVERCRIC